MTQHLAKVTSSCFSVSLRSVIQSARSSSRSWLARSFYRSSTTQFSPVYQSQPSCRFNALRMRTQQCGWSSTYWWTITWHQLLGVQVHWLPVDRRVEFTLCSTMHAIHTGQCPTYSGLRRFTASRTLKFFRKQLKRTILSYVCFRRCVATHARKIRHGRQYNLPHCYSFFYNVILCFNSFFL